MERHAPSSPPGGDYNELNARILGIATAYAVHGEAARAWALRGLVDGWTGCAPAADVTREHAQYYRRGYELGRAADWHGWDPRPRVRIVYCAIDPCACSMPSGAHAPGCPAGDIDLPRSGGAPCGR